MCDASIPFSVVILAPRLLEEDTRIETIWARDPLEALKKAEETLAPDEYVHHITVRYSEDDLTRLVWHYTDEG